MYNVKRPSTKETDADLIELDAILKQQHTQSQPIDKSKIDDDSNAQINKRKTACPLEPKEKKKKKENIVDYNVFEEAVSDTKKKSAVVGRIVERDVSGAAEYLKKWNPSSSKHGFPSIPQLSCLDKTKPCGNGKSAFMLQLQSEGKAKIKTPVDVTMKDKSVSKELQNKEFSSSGQKEHRTMITPSTSLHGQSVLGIKEAANISTENRSLLSSMSNEEILEARSYLQMNHKAALDKMKSLKPKSTKAHMDVGNSVIETDDNMDTESEVTVTETSAKILLSDTSLPVDELKSLMGCGIEYKKLKWLTQPPKPKPLKNGEGYLARFNFEGDLLPYDTNISVHEGLHHHGSEPGRAGYTIDELFILVRSRIAQQRHIGLKVLANILRNAKEGLYDKCFDQSIIQLMVDAGVVILLRFAIDETTAAVYQEGLRALYYLVCNEPDEQCLAMVSSWSPHSIVPGVSIKSNYRRKKREELDKEEKELKDVEILKLDIIRALIRMDTHLRMKYFLTTVRPSPPDVINILGILSSMARHSLGVAWTLAGCRDLLPSIVEHFLPHSLADLMTGSNALNVKSVYRFPLRHALKFLKVMCDRGRQLAILISDLPNLMQIILTYVSVEPTEIAMPQAEVMRLAVDTYSLWSTMLSYGLTKAQEAFVSFYPMFVKQLVFYRDRVDANNSPDGNLTYDVGTEMVNVLTKALLVASRYSLMVHHQNISRPLVAGRNGKLKVLPPPVLRWELFDDVVPLVESCLQKWFAQLSRCSVSFRTLRMIGSFLYFLTTYVENWRHQDNFNGPSMSRQTVKVFGFVKPFLQSASFDDLLKTIARHSLLCSDSSPGEFRDPENLSSIGSVTRGGEVVPILRTNSPFTLLLPLTQFLLVLLTENPMVDDGLLDCLLDNEAIIEYISVVNTSSSKIADNWFARMEVFTLRNFLQLAVRKGKYSQLLHETAIGLLPLIRKGDEHLLVSVIDVICDGSFAMDLLGIESRMESVQLENFIVLPSPAAPKSEVVLSLPKMTEESIHSAGQIIMDSISIARGLDASARTSNAFFLINSLTHDIEDNSPVVDGYWSLQLLRNLANGAKQDDALVPTIRKLFSLTYLLLKHRKISIYKHTNPTGWYRYLSLVFTIGSNLFLDREISQLAQVCLRETLANGGCCTISPSVPLPDLPFCFDWYRNFVEQFSSVSYFDATFATFVIIPQQMSWPETYRVLLWDDFIHSLRYITLTCRQVEQFLPVKRFLEPVERNDKVINSFHRAIQGGFVNPQKNPFLYYVAYYHIKNQPSNAS